jgi:hypothetical protein
MLFVLCGLARAQVVVDEVRPQPLPVFEPLQDLHGGLDTLLNFEMTLRNSGTAPIFLDGLEAIYKDNVWGPIDHDRGTLRKALTGGARYGWGPTRTGTATNDLSELEHEEIVDIALSGRETFVALHGDYDNPYAAGDDFLVGKLSQAGAVAEFQVVEFPWADEARAHAVIPSDEGFVAVGGAKVATPAVAWEFAAAEVIAETGDFGMELGWVTTVSFPGCTAEAVDVEAIPDPGTGGAVGYFLTGTATCAGVRQVAAAWLATDGTELWSDTFPFAAGTVTVGGAAMDEDGNSYVVGQWTNDVFVLKLTSGGAVDGTYGAMGVGKIVPSTHTDVMCWEAKIDSVGRVVLGCEAQHKTTLKYEMGAARFTTGGAFDMGFGTKGWAATAIPGQDQAWGRDIELMGANVLVTGYSTSSRGDAFAAASFLANGTLNTAFDTDGRLALLIGTPARAYRSDQQDNLVFLAGSRGDLLASTSFHALDGTPNDPTVLSSGEKRVLTWADNVHEGETRPSQVTATIQWKNGPSGSVLSMVRTHPLDTGAVKDRPFPLEPSEEPDTYWTVVASHDADDPGGRQMPFAFEQDAAPWELPHRFAYEFELYTWVPDDFESPPGYWSYAVPNEALSVMAMSSGTVVGCRGPGSSSIGLPGTAQLPWIWQPPQVAILTGDGEVELYSGFALDEELCDHELDTFQATLLPRPIVEKGQVIGTSTGRLSVAVTTGWEYVGGLTSPAADGRPLVFEDIYAVSSDLLPEQIPSTPAQLLPGALPVGSRLVHPPPPPPPEPETNCEPTGGVDNPDGDFGIGWSCSDDDGESVCVDMGDHGECKSCDEGVFPGCGCDDDDDCGLDMTCWGEDVQNIGSVDLPGRCYPHDHVPSWQCPYDCEAQYGSGAWCFHNQYDQAHCYEPLTDEMDATQCREHGWTDGDDCDDACPPGDTGCLDDCGGGPKGAYDGECIIECEVDSDCQDDWGYPSEYVCKLSVGVAICELPEGL